MVDYHHRLAVFINPVEANYGVDSARNEARNVAVDFFRISRDQDRFALRQSATLPCRKASGLLPMKSSPSGDAKARAVTLQ